MDEINEENKEIEATYESKEPKKDELNSHKKEVGGDEEIKKKKSKPKKAKNNKKKYKRVKLNKNYEAVPDYIIDEKKEETKKTGQEIEDRDIEIMDYGGYEDDDDEENKDIF